jgi:hypothetical protein
VRLWLRLNFSFLHPHSKAGRNVEGSGCINIASIPTLWKQIHHGTFLTLEFLKSYFEKIVVICVIFVQGCVLAAKMPCGNRDHEHPPWPHEGAHEFAIEACENHCGWCGYQTKSANNLRVVSSLFLRKREQCLTGSFLACSPTCCK